MSSPYNSVDRSWPVQVEFDESGSVAKLLLNESWYEPMKWVYDRWKSLMAIGETVDVSESPIGEVGLPEIPELTVEVGWLGLKIFVIRLVMLAAEKGIELSKFELHTGGWGPCQIGWSPMGGVLYREV